MLKHGILYFCNHTNNWIFQDINANAYALHCGDGLEIKVAGRYRPCRLELAEDWYVIFRDASFVLQQGVEYSARCF